jgi:hypothetical protein
MERWLQLGFMIPQMRSSHCLLLGGLAVFTSAAMACGGGNARSGFGEEEQIAATDPSGEGASGGPVGGFGGDAAQNVTLEPKNTTVIIDTATTPITPGSAAFKVTKNGADITAGATFTLKDSSLGAFNGATFTSVGSLPAGVLGKSTTVQVQTDKGQALGTITVVQLRKTGPSRDFFFVVPYGEDPAPKSDVLKFSTNIKQADVAFVMDTTGSMDGSITNLKTALQSTLLSQLQAAIPNVGLAIVDYKDYPTAPYGDAGGSFLGIVTPKDFPVLVRQKITTTLSLATTAVGQYKASGGNDLPESQIPAMQHVLTGEALASGGANVAAASVTQPGHWGGVEFRPGSAPVVVNITDIDWHGEGHTPYPFATPTMASLKAAFLARNAFFVNITSSDESQANDLSDATKSYVAPAAFGGTCGAGQCCTGVGGAARAPTGPGGTCRLNFQHSNGSGVSGGVVKAIQAIAVGSTFDVKAAASNDPKNAKGVDATKFIKALRAMDEGNPANGCPAAPAKDSDGDGIKDTFLAVKAGTPVCFEVIPAKNGIVPPELDPQFFNAFVDVIAVQGNLALDKRSVLFLVPPKDAGVK